MNAMPSAIRREASQPTFEQIGQSANVLPFHNLRPDVWSLTPPMPRLNPFDSKDGDDCLELTSTQEAPNAARIRRDPRHTTYQIDSPSIHQPVFVTVMPAFHNLATCRRPAVSRHSTAVLHGGHLMHHFGSWVVALISCQLGSAWIMGIIAGQTLGSGRYFHTATWVLLMMTFNLAVWFRYYGKKAKAFHVPGLGLFLAAILPVILIELLA